jgi:hypothetical protein
VLTGRCLATTEPKEDDGSLLVQMRLATLGLMCLTRYSAKKTKISFGGHSLVPESFRSRHRSRGVRGMQSRSSRFADTPRRAGIVHSIVGVTFPVLGSHQLYFESYSDKDVLFYFVLGKIRQRAYVAIFTREAGVRYLGRQRSMLSSNPGCS